MNSTLPIQPNAIASARRFGCTIAQAKALFAKNAAGFRQMAEKAERTGRKVNGYTSAQLRASEAAYRTASL